MFLPGPPLRPWHPGSSFHPVLGALSVLSFRLVKGLGWKPSPQDLGIVSQALLPLETMWPSHKYTQHLPP